MLLRTTRPSLRAPIMLPLKGGQRGYSQTSRVMGVWHIANTDTLALNTDTHVLLASSEMTG
jgi:hypothetical protein